MSSQDTICAISTPPGRGGIAVVRVSGPEAIGIADSLWNGKRLSDAKSHTAHLGTLRNADGSSLDQCVATVFRAPRSFTGEDVVELAVHGSAYIQQEALEALSAAGARLALPGEFTRRAFVNGRLDLAQAEAVADIIASSSKAAHRLAMSQLKGDFSRHIDSLRDQLITLASLLELELDFSEEDVSFADREHLRHLATDVKATVDRLSSTFRSGQAIRNGIPVAIVGQPNVGKSRLLNSLLGSDRAIVSDIPGTTRDTVEDTFDIDGTSFRLIDTAGIRQTDDPVEQLGISRAISKATTAHIVLWIIAPEEISDPAALKQFRSTLPSDLPVVLLVNKTDTLDEVATAAAKEFANSAPSKIGVRTATTISALTGQGLDNLRATLLDISRANLPSDESLIVANARHNQALREASRALADLLQAMDLGLTPDLLAQHLRESISALGAITGAITTPDILSTIFSRFCIGK